MDRFDPNEDDESDIDNALDDEDITDENMQFHCFIIFATYLYLKIPVSSGCIMAPSIPD